MTMEGAWAVSFSDNGITERISVLNTKWQATHAFEKWKLWSRCGFMERLPGGVTNIYVAFSIRSLIKMHLSKLFAIFLRRMQEQPDAFSISFHKRVVSENPSC